jgi:hypothetical protein
VYGLGLGLNIFTREIRLSDLEAAGAPYRVESPISISHVLAVALISLIATAPFSIAAYVLVQLGNAPDISEVAQQIVPRWRYYLKLEPLERAAYLGAVVAIFPVMLVVAAALSKKKSLWWFEQFYPFIALLTFLFLSATLLTGAFSRLVFTGEVDGSTGILFIPLWLQTIAAMILAVVVCYHRKRLPVGAGAAVSVNVALGLIAVSLAALRIRTADTTYGEINLEAVLYSVTQVVGGRATLSDFPAQYGLYSEILGPLFRAIGLSVVSFTATLAVLQVIALLALLSAFWMIVQSPFLRLVGGMCLLLHTGPAWRQIHADLSIYEYPQLWPLRALFPMLILALFATAHRRGMRIGDLFLVAIVAGVALVWNFDWGVPAYGALVAFFVLALVTCSRPERPKALTRLAVSIVVPVCVSALFVLYLSAKSGWQIELAQWVKYQQIFYASGFGMLPLPLGVHAWMGIIVIYVIGLSCGISARIGDAQSLRSDTIFFASVLGIGIFTYYQGRSHDVVLSFVVWPAIIIAFAITDWIWESSQKKLEAAKVWMIIPIVTLGIMSSFLLLWGMPRILTSKSVFLADVTPPPITRTNVDFILSRTNGGGTAVIFSKAQAVLFAETGLVSSLKGPGAAETLLVEDEKQQLLMILEERPTHLFIDGEGTSIPEIYQPLLEGYNIVDVSDFGLVYLTPKN